MTNPLVQKARARRLIAQEYLQARKALRASNVVSIESGVLRRQMAHSCLFVSYRAAVGALNKNKTSVAA